VPSARVLPRLVRHLWRLRGRFEEQQGNLLSEIATAVDTVVDSNPVTRAALRAYRLAMRTLLLAALVGVLAGAALAIGFRDSTLGLVAGLVLIAGSLFLGWQWWLWSAGLRLLKEHVDPARRVPLRELPAHLVRLADEVRPTSGQVASELEELAGLVRDRAPTGRR
jgi:hypothetical protein